MNNSVDYGKMLQYFTPNDLKALLEAFGQNKVGRRAELRERALELLSSRPNGLNYAAYLSKIYEIFHFLSHNRPKSSNNNMMHSSMQTQQSQMMSINQNQIPQQRLPQYHQQSMCTPQPRLPHLMTKMEGGIYGNPTGANAISGNTMANNNIQYVSGNYQPVRPQMNVLSPSTSQMPSNQQDIYAMSLVSNESTGGNNNGLIPSSQIEANYKFKKLPFYDVIEEVIKPTPLNSSRRCTLLNSPTGMRECNFKHSMSAEQASLISMNRDISVGQTGKYDFQYQIRICELKNDVHGEVTDYFPIGLQIRVGNYNCTLPPFVNLKQSAKPKRRLARHINITRLLKLCPLLTTSITINWIPDGKNYALAMYIVKHLSVDTLMERLHDKKARSSEETKNYIIKKLTNVDPDLTATSSYNFSLICPLSKVRMKIPAKSIHCDHIQCFDAHTFILMNEKKPKWMCPTCNKSCLYDDIQIENYFLEILASPTLKDNINVIEVLADGSWIIPGENQDAKNMNSTIDNNVKSIDFIDLDESDNEKCIELKEEPRPGGSECQESENLKPYIIDITMDEDE